MSASLFLGYIMSNLAYPLSGQTLKSINFTNYVLFSHLLLYNILNKFFASTVKTVYAKLLPHLPKQKQNGFP